MRVIKKYSNRRLYDTETSGYITLDELAETIRGGADVRVVDAKTSDDLTQATLAQIIVDSRHAAKLLPAPLLTQMIRMDDHALGEFLSKYMTWALEMYMLAKRGANHVSPVMPLATLPFTMGNAMARMMQNLPWGGSQEPPPPPPVNTKSQEDIDDLRQEIEALKEALHGQRAAK
jgi:polyhydroxyalkanoate synthesis repressor PhaR